MKALALLRTLVMCFLYPFYLTITSLSFILFNYLFLSRSLDNRIIKYWGAITCRMFGVSVQVRGLENIPNGGCLFVFNHTSFFDIFAMSAAFPGFRFGAKKELFQIPFFGPAMSRAGVLVIDRADRREVYKVYDNNREKILRGEKFALAPEGTRQNAEILAPFKTGPFIFAIGAKAPIVPVIIKNANAVMPKKSWLPNWDAWHRTIEIQVLPPVLTEEETFESRHELQKKVYNIMKDYFTVCQV